MFQVFKLFCKYWFVHQIVYEKPEVNTFSYQHEKRLFIIMNTYNDNN